MKVDITKAVGTDLRCPKCGATVITDGEYVWCTYIGSSYDPACDWGLVGEPITLRAAFQDEVAIVMLYTGWPRQTAQAAISQWRRHDPTWTADHIISYLLYRWQRGLPPQRLPWPDLTDNSHWPNAGGGSCQHSQ